MKKEINTIKKEEKKIVEKEKKRKHTHTHAIHTILYLYGGLVVQCHDMPCLTMCLYVSISVCRAMFVHVYTYMQHTSCYCMLCPSDEHAFHYYRFWAPHMSRFFVSRCSFIFLIFLCILRIYLTVWLAIQCGFYFQRNVIQHDWKHIFTLAIVKPLDLATMIFSNFCKLKLDIFWSLRFFFLIITVLNYCCIESIC